VGMAKNPNIPTMKIVTRTINPAPMKERDMILLVLGA